MAYNKTSEERKWNYWKEQEEKKLRELGMEEEKIQKLRQKVCFTCIYMGFMKKQLELSFRKR